jgi:hypothetical protein
MMKINKTLIATYAELKSEKATSYLVGLANQMMEEIISSRNNDEILSMLDALGEFAFRVPEQTVTIAEHLVRHPRDTGYIEAFGGRFVGKTYEDVVASVIELLERLRYIHPTGVLPLLAELMRLGNTTLTSRASEAVKKFAKYDFNVLTKTKIGYGAQRKALDFVLAWSREEQLQNINFLTAVAQQVLSSAVEGTSMETADTITLHSGVVQPTEFLKTLRRETIELLATIYHDTTDDKVRLLIVKTLDEAARTPLHVAYNDDVRAMVIEDAEYLIKLYRNMLFDDSGTFVGSLAVTEEIEKRLYWIERSKKVGSDSSRKLRADILGEAKYALFRLLAGDSVAFHAEDGWEEAERKRSESLDNEVENVRDETVGVWRDDLNKIAAQSEFLGDWQFNPFRDFLYRLASRKPEIAADILTTAISEGGALRKFSASVMAGLREANRLDLWDQVIRLIPPARETGLTAAIPLSLARPGRLRDEDIRVLDDIANSKGEFGFHDEANESVLVDSIARAVFANFKSEPDRMEPLLIQTFSRFDKWSRVLIRELEAALRRELFTAADLGTPTIDYLKRLLVELPDLDWEAQNLLLRLGRVNYDTMLDVFRARIERARRRETNRGDVYEWRNYSAIPFDINEELCREITESSAFIDRIRPWIDHAEEDVSYRWNISQFLQQMGSSFQIILKSLIESGREDDLAIAAALLNDMSGTVDVALAMEIVGRTDDERIWSRIGTTFYDTGVVSGEDGIARAHELRAEELSIYLESDNTRIRTFAERMTERLAADAKQERRRVEEERRLREIEFEK